MARRLTTILSYFNFEAMMKKNSRIQERLAFFPQRKNTSRITCDSAKRCVIASFGATLATVDVGQAITFDGVAK
jgi:hypothetical protein